MADYEISSPDDDPSEDFEERLSALKANWKAALKRNKKLLLKCPNYDRCGFKCGSVGGMHYHFVRCAGKPPEFKCAHCSRSYESRTGLNYHMASFHSNDPNPSDLKSESSARPQRSAALTTMSAIHIANNLPPLKQTFQKPPISHKTTPQGSTHNTTPPKKAANPTSIRKNVSLSGAAATKGVHSSKSMTSASQKSALPSPTLKTTPPKKTTPTMLVPKEALHLSEVKLQPAIILPKKVAKPPPPLPQLIGEPLVIPPPKKSPLLSPLLKPAHKQPKTESSEKGKRGRYITIPSIEYPDEYKYYLPLWRQEMKDNTVIKCPNFSECEFKCTTVNGMKYHFVRCMKSNPPEFNCELCEKRFQCRTGLVWHLKKTHKMIDIQPTKSGGYKGSLPIELKFDSDLEDEDDEQMMGAFQLPPQTVSPMRKKIKLDKPWGRQSRTGYSADGSHEEDSALESSTQSGSEGDDEEEMFYDDKPSSRSKLRKCSFPRRTAEVILQNTAFSRVPPKPRLGPATSKFHVPAVEFFISHEVGTDADPKPSFDLFLGVEALEWQKMYSDSESESDYNPEYDDTGRVINYQSNSSVSDSDEEFMCSLTTRKKTTGQRGPKPKGGGGVGGGAGGNVGGSGKTRKGRGARINESNSSSKNVPMLVKPPEDMSYGSPGIQPPPLLIKHQPQDLSMMATAATTNASIVGEEVRSSEIRVAHLPSVPALVKAPDRVGCESSNDIDEFDRLTSIGMPSQQHPPRHIQPPPSLVMPSPSSSSTPSIVSPSSSAAGSQQRRREPPPLVRNTDKQRPLTTPNSTTMELQDSAHSARPQIICLSPSEQQQQQQLQQRRAAQGVSPGSLSYSIVTQTPQPSYSIVTQQTTSQTNRNSQPQLSAVSVDGRRGQPPNKPRRPGRPRKDQSITSSTGLRTSAKTVRLGGGGARGGASAKTHYRSGRGGGRGGQNSSHSTKKGMKMTQYEFENVSSSFPSAIGHHPQALQQQQQQAQQPQLFQVGSGAGVAQNLQSLVTPLQIIPAASIPGYHGVSSGGMLLVQNTPQGVTLAAAPNSNDVVAPTTILGGNTYQLVQAAPMLATDQGENAQKVSVIMHPTAGMGTSVQYIAQFDGPPPKRKSKASKSREELYKKFDEERKKEQTKLELDTAAVSTRSKSKYSKTSNSEPAALAGGSSNESAEKLMSSELEKYLKMEESRSKSKTVATSSDSGSSRRKTKSPSGAAARRKRPHSATVSLTNVEETTEAGVPEEEEEEPIVTKKTKTKAKKPVLGKRKSRRTKVKETEEEEDGEPSPPPNEEGTPLTSPPPSKQKKIQLKEETENERTAPASNEEMSETMESESPLTSTAAATPTGRGRSKGRGRRRGSTSKPKHEEMSETMESELESPLTSTAAATPTGRGRSKGRVRGRGSTSKPKYPCDECGKEYVSQASLLGHKEKEHGQQFKKTQLNEEIESERTAPASDEEMSETMEPESPLPSTAAATPTGRGRSRGRGRGRSSTSKRKYEEMSETMESELESPLTSTAAATPTGRGRSKGRGRGRGSTSKPKYVCDECGKEYVSQASLLGHKEKEHSQQLSSESTLEECVKEWRLMFKRKKSVFCPKCGTHKGNSVGALKYHWEKCGKTLEELALFCPECGKAFKSAAGLNYHTKYYHVDPMEDRTESDFFAEADISKPTPERRAAKQAVERLIELTRSIGVQATTSSLLVDGDEGKTVASYTPPSKREVVFGEFGFTQEEMNGFKAKIEQDKSMECPVESCARTFKSYAGLRYHLKRHINSIDSLKCPQCRKVLGGRKRFENHIRSKHPDLDVELMNLEDYEYRPGEHEDSEEELPEDGEARRSRSSHKKKTSLLVADAPVTLHQYQSTLKEKIEQLYGHREGEEQGEGPLQSPSWQPMTEDWVRVQDSELAFYLPTSTRSMNYALELEGETATTTDSTLPLFGTAESSDGTAMFFTGGPVWAMDWLCMRDGQGTPTNGEQHLVLTAYRDYDETFPIDVHLSHKGLLQVWMAGDLTLHEQQLPSSSSPPPPPGGRSLPQLRLGIAHNFGCIRAIKSCPHSNGLAVGVANKGDAPLHHHLGVLALACSDGCVRILNIPDPTHLHSVLPSPKKTAAKSKTKKVNVDPTALFVKPRKVSAILVPSGLGVQDWSSFGQCLCIDWFPGNQHTRIAAGYYNGYVCIWDLGSSLLNSGTAAAVGARQQLHPLIQIMGQNEPCRALAWCPHDHNYLVTGGHSKSLTLWDIRQPFSPVDKQDKGFISYEIVWPLLWCHTLLLHDSSASTAHSYGVQHCSYIVKPPYISHKTVTSNLGPLSSMSYSDWTDRVVATSFAGDVSVTSFDSSYHVSATPKNFLTTSTDKHKFVCHCYTKLLEESTSAEQASDTITPAAVSQSSPTIASTMKEKARTHRLIFSRQPPSKLQPGASSSYQLDTLPLAAFTKVCWNPHQGTSDWLVLATNNGLVQLLHLPRN